MGLLVVIPFGALAAFVIFRIHRWLRRGKFGPEWWRAFRLLSLAGVGLGLGFVLLLRYRVGNVHLEGFPIPLRIASRDTPEGPWAFAAIPTPVRAGAVITDLLYGVVICLTPLSLAAFIKENKGAKDFSSGPQG
jgi:hypothetical protein